MTRARASLRSARTASAVLLLAALGCSRTHRADASTGPRLREQGGAGTSEPSAVPAARDAHDDTSDRAAEIAVGASTEREPEPEREPGPGSESAAAIAAASHSTPSGPSVQTSAAAITVADLAVPSPQILLEDGAAVPSGVWTGSSRQSFACTESAQITLLFGEPVPGRAPRATIVFGSDPFPDSEVDPERGFPLGDSAEMTQCRSQAPSAGFPYDVLDGGVSRAGRFAFRVAATQPLTPWCALQTSVPAGSSSTTDYWCLPDLPFEQFSGCETTDDPPCPVTPGKFWLCWTDACVCVSDGCRANLNRTFSFDLQIRDADMEGYVSLPWEDEPIEVRLRRVE
jgi:hypothetical protein